jgi:RNA polymerase sigma-70 factor, ECF subfamily
MASTQALSPEEFWTDAVRSIQSEEGGRWQSRSSSMTTPDHESEKEFEAKLIARIAEGDDAAFVALYQRFAGSLYALAQRILQDAKEAEDALQDGFTYIWRKAATYDLARSSPFAWAAMITRNKAIDRLRSRERMEKLHGRVLEQDAQISQQDVASANEPAIRERARIVHSALLELPEEQKQALELSFFTGLTHEEIAQRLGVPLGTIKARIRRALLRLRERLGEGL